MLTLSESTMQNLQSTTLREGMEKIARVLHECFPDRMIDTEYALTYPKNSFQNMKKFPIEDEELPYWTFLSVIMGNEHFYEAPEMQDYFSLEGREKVRQLFHSVQNHISN